MTKAIVIDKGRTTTVKAKLGFDISQDTFTSQIRLKEDVSSELIAEWVVVFTTDGIDGELTLTLDDSVSRDVKVANAFMDIKRVTGGEPVSVFDKPLPVVFRGTVTE